MLAIDVRTPDFGRLVNDLAATEAQVKRALSSTLRKMATWVRARSVKGLSKELQLQQKIVRRRLKAARLRQTSSGPEITVWYGLNPVALIYLQAKQDKRPGGGVTASGGRAVKGAFIAKMPGGALQVFKRRDKARLPIGTQEATVDDKSERYIERDALGAEFEAQFFKVFEHELQWQTR